MEEFVKKTLLFVCLLALCNLTLFAQTGKHPRTRQTTEKSAIHVAPQEADVALKKIFSNLGKSKTNLYLDTTGWSLSGPTSSDGFTQFVGMAFTPKANSTVKQVEVAAQYISGANQVNLSIYGDTNNAPGTLLVGPVTVTNLPTFGTCCALAIANFGAGVAVTAGTQYWVVADTPSSGTGSDLAGVWDFVVPPIAGGFNVNGSGWFSNDVNTQSAGEVLGTIP
jgi:hypothetical protein